MRRSWFVLAVFWVTVAHAQGVPESITFTARLSDAGAPLTGAHGFAYETGTDVNYEDQRIAGNTLLLEGDGQLLRIEGAITRDRALGIARSVQ